jgi:TPR repeat protein
MKKILSVLLVALLMVGCGDEPGGDSPSESNQTSSSLWAALIRNVAENPYPEFAGFAGTSEEQFEETLQKALDEDADAQLQLSHIYIGKGLMGGDPWGPSGPPYFTHYYKWLNRAAENGHLWAKFELAQFCRTYGDPIEFEGDVDELWDNFAHHGRGKQGRASLLYKEVDQLLLKESHEMKLEMLMEIRHEDTMKRLLPLSFEASRNKD